MKSFKLYALLVVVAMLFAACAPAVEAPAAEAPAAEAPAQAELKLGINAQAGYLFADNLMAVGTVAYNHVGSSDVSDYVSVGAQGRYYIIQNGLYLGLGAKYVHSGGYNDVMPGLEVGYAFFVSKTVTVEPAMYYDQSLKDHSDFSTIGFKVGVGVYL